MTPSIRTMVGVLLGLFVVPVLFYSVGRSHEGPYWIRMPFYEDIVEGRALFVLPAVCLTAIHWALLFFQTRRGFADHLINWVVVSSGTLALVFVQLAFSSLQRGVGRFILRSVL